MQNSDLLTPEEFGKKMDLSEKENRRGIILFEDADGNWRGATRVSGKFVNVRAGDPNTALVSLLTHDGKA